VPDGIEAARGLPKYGERSSSGEQVFLIPTRIVPGEFCWVNVRKPPTRSYTGATLTSLTIRFEIRGPAGPV